MQFFILGLDGKHLVVDFEPETKIDAVADYFESVTGIPASRVLFIYAGKFIRQGARLVDAGIQSESTLKVNLRFT